ncbi:MAG: hypothetical protein ACK5P8_01090 [Phycisphaerae bacterium]
MPFVQLLFAFARDQFGLFGGSGGRRVAKRPRRGRPAKGRVAPIARVRPVVAPVPVAGVAAPPAGWSMVKPPKGVDHAKPSQRRYDAMVVEMLAKYGLSVKRWRNSLSGVAIERTYRDGRVERTLESPYPTSPLRLAIFLHEVGHHAIGLGVHKPRCLEEYHAWQYSLSQMRQWNITITPRVMQRYQRSMKYAVGKAKRRGIRVLPSELLPFAQ